jgi:PAS domain S-box-containing protein
MRLFAVAWFYKPHFLILEPNPFTFMANSQEIRLQARLGNWSLYLTFSVISLGVLVLLGWQFDIEFLKRPIKGLLAMNPLTALLFVLSGSALYFRLGKTTANLKGLALVLSGIVFILAFIKFVNVVTATDSGIDLFLYRQSMYASTDYGMPTRMGMNTAMCFMCVSLVNWLAGYESRIEKKLPSQYIALAPGLLSILSLLGYLYGVPAFYGTPQKISMAIHTSAGFLCFSLAILFSNPAKGFMKVFTGTSPGSRAARLLIPAAIIIPSLLGYLRLLGVRAGLYSAEFGVASLVLSIIAIFVLLIWHHSVSLNIGDEIRNKVEDQLEQHIRQLRESEEKFQKVFQSSAVGISITQISDTTFQDVNEAFLAITGYSRSELIGKSSAHFNLVVDTEKRARALKEVKDKGTLKNMEMSVRTKMGAVVDVLASVETITVKGEKLAINFIYDITERTRAEKQLNKSMELFSKLFEENPAALTISRLSDGKVINANTATLTLFGFTDKSEIIGKSGIEAGISYDQKLRDEIVPIIREKGRMQGLESSFVTSKGQTIWTSTSMLVIEVNEEPCLLTVNIDISELKRTSEQLHATNKELEAFSYSVSHDLRAPLRAIDGYAKMLEEDLGASLANNEKRLLSVIQYNAQKMSQLIDDLLAFSRLGRKSLHKSELDMAKLVENVVREVGKTFNHNAEIRVATIPPVKGDYSLLTLVLTNLISNAVKYSSKKPNPVVEIYAETNSDSISYHVKDNGDGFDMKYADKLFGVFQRLHSPREFDGTGVGLAIVQRVISKHGGKVKAFGESGKGAIFSFTLPIN